MAAESERQSDTTYPSYYVAHAGVGLLVRKDPVNEEVKKNLALLGQDILSLKPQPRGLIVFSGHFEAAEIHGPGVIEVNVKPDTPILHDFVNDFHDTHPELYKEDWKHYDEPSFGQEIWEHLKAQGIKTKRVERGIDHGVWVPFRYMFPEGSLKIPIVLVSTFHGYDLESQVRLGKAVQALSSKGFAIIGSGMAVHSFASLEEIEAAAPENKKEVTARVLTESIIFHEAVIQAATVEEEDERNKALLELEDLYEFKRSHPTVEHFTPLLVAAAATGKARVETTGADLVQPGFGYGNFKFIPAN